MSAAEVNGIREDIKILSTNIAVLTERFDALEKKVELHNGLVERMYCQEGKMARLCADHDRIQNEKEKKRINWSAIFQSILSGVTLALIVKILIEKM